MCSMRKKDAKLIYGLYHDVTKEQLRRSIEDGTVEKYLQKVPVKKNDLFYIEAGTIHAIGAGVLVAEIQESSNLTYRLYDYDRVGKDGKKRELHIDKALETADLNASAEPRQPLRVLKYRRGCASELLCRCKYFEVYVCWSIPSDAGSLWTIGRMAAPSACCSAPTDAAASPSEISPQLFPWGLHFCPGGFCGAQNPRTGTVPGCEGIGAGLFACTYPGVDFGGYFRMDTIHPHRGSVFGQMPWGFFAWTKVCWERAINKER